jgi:hypothetical protein
MADTDGIVKLTVILATGQVHDFYNTNKSQL